MTKSHTLLCHIVDTDGAFTTQSYSFDGVMTAEILLQQPEIHSCIRPGARVFTHPGEPALPSQNLGSYQEIFILGPARISPQQWRQQRLQVAQTTQKR